MVNAISLGHQFHSLLPAGEVPERTEDYEGFYHLMNSKVMLKSNITIYHSHHDRESFELRKKKLLEIRDDINVHYEDFPVK